MDSTMNSTLSQRTLPFLPGNTFDDTWLKDRHHKKQIFNYRNNMPVVNDLSVPEDMQDMSTMDLSLTAQKLATLQFGNTTTLSNDSDDDQSKTLTLDRKVLRFYGYFKESVVESNWENMRVRKVVVYYYLEDDTMHVSEPRVDNSGIPQGVLIKRQRIPKPGYGNNEFFTLYDLNVGEEVTLYGKTIRLVDCDLFTKDFFEALGIEVGAPEPYPADPYTEKREEEKRNTLKKGRLTADDVELKRYMEYAHMGKRCNPSASEREAMQRFLKKDRQVLRFYACWDDRESLYGDSREFVIEYTLADGCIKVAENYPANSGYDPFPLFIKKIKLPKPNRPGEFYTETDLGIGRKIDAFGRTFLIYDWDKFTEKYYFDKYGERRDPIDVRIKQKPPVKIDPPPYNGFGDEEDSLGSWKYLVLKPPKRDLKKLIEKDRHQLRFGAVMDTDAPEDVNREFIVTYYLADDTLAIFEPPKRNSGIVGGKFLQRQRVKSDRTGEYIKPQDLFVGATLEVNNYKFILNKTDEHTIKYMEARPKEFSLANVEAVIRKIRDTVNQRHDLASRAFRELDLDKSGKLSIDEIRYFLATINLKLTEQELISVMRYFDLNNDGEIDFYEFKVCSIENDVNNVAMVMIATIGMS